MPKSCARRLALSTQISGKNKVTLLKGPLRGYWINADLANHNDENNNDDNNDNDDDDNNNNNNNNENENENDNDNDYDNSPGDCSTLKR